MNYPSEVTVKGYPYTIEYVNLPREVGPNLDQTTWLGSCNQDVIRTLATLEPYAILDTLIHEILHVIFHKNQLLASALSSADLEEPFIDTLALELAQLLTQNNWVDLPLESPPITHRIVTEDVV